MSKEELVTAIESIEKQLAASVVHPCEIWSRVVGYYQKTSSFNLGKQEEFKKRALFDASVSNIV